MISIENRIAKREPERIGNRLDDAIGNTPLVPLRRLAPDRGAPILVKLEGLNPGGSVKARTALAIVNAAERAGLLGEGTTLLDASSGNTGIAYAMLCAERGYACEICLPANASEERRQLLRAYGARLVLTAPELGSDGAIAEARRRAADGPDRYYYADQYNNPANVEAHYTGTGEEIWGQTRGRITHFVAGLGTTGTFVGAGRRLRHHQPGVRLIAVQPASAFHGIEGLKHLPSAIVPGIWDPGLPDRILGVETEEAQAMARRLALEEGLLAGVSGGAAVVAARRVAASLPADALVVTVLPDGGERYLSEPWMEVESETAGDTARDHRHAVGRATARTHPVEGPPMTLRIEAAALARIRDEAARGYPEEVCGALLGHDGGSGAGRTIVGIAPVANARTDQRERRYLIGPDALLRIERTATADGLEVVGFYHSHPDHPAEPSEFDRAHSWPWYTYVIVGVRGGEPGEARAWRLRADRSRFEEEQMAVGEEEGRVGRARKT